MSSNRANDKSNNKQPNISARTNTPDTIDPPSVADYSDKTKSAKSADDESKSCTTSSEELNRKHRNWNTKLREFAEEYEIKMKKAQHLEQLADYEIVIVCDDSGSMRTTVDNTQRTRWDELRDIVKIVLRIGVIFDSNGVDIYFLNGRTFKNVKDPKQVDEAFNVRPRGYTPLVPVIREIFKLPASRRGYDKKLLVFVATDGEPTDEDGNETIHELYNLMVKDRRAETTHVTFLLCTDDPTCVGYLNDWNKKMVNVDVTDDFNTEKQKISQNRGDRYRFSFGDYVIQALLGSIDPQMKSINGPNRQNT